MYHASIGPATGFRVANQSDIIPAARMIFESYAPYIPIMGKIPPTIFEDFGEHIAGGNLWLAEHDMIPIGIVVLTPCDDHLLLQSMAVLPSHQKRGIGRCILRFSESLARHLGKPSIKLYTNSLMERNQRIYRKNGYRETHRTRYDWGWRVHMEKKISSRKKASFEYLSHAFG